MANIRTKIGKNRYGATVKKFELTYADKSGRRYSRTFNSKRDADAARIRIETEIYERRHVTRKNSRTVLQGLRAWLDYMEGLEKAHKRERTTIDKYRSHLKRYIAPSEIANVSLAELQPADVQSFVEFLEKTLKTAYARKIYHTLTMGLKYCRKHQWLMTIPTEYIRIEARDREQSGKIKIPTKKELKALIEAADKDITGFDGALVRVAAFCGLRPSELRGLSRSLVRFTTEPPTLEVEQRADIFGKLGNPKSRAGYRKIPFGPDTALALKKVMLSCKPGRHNLVFTNSEGNVLNYHNFVHRQWPRLMKRAGLATEEIVTYSDPTAKYKVVRPFFSFYALRHVAASLWIEMGIAPKRIQELMGHSSLKMTMDTYGHLWANPEADKKIAIEIEKIVG